ncbi:hypothetical protein ACFSSA_10775 [Luteolibacter algae]|uniref:Lipoprotein n=1 Tax=Luteolibacter algae TaxID=454151 RepID=A0ABW5D9Q8_9BACT
MSKVGAMGARKISQISCLLLLVTSFIFAVSCKSRKGEHVQIFAEAKQLQNSLRGTGIVTREELLTQIDRVEVDGIRRWKISMRKNILIESIKAYRDYRNPSEMEKFIYSINRDFDIVLINK